MNNSLNLYYIFYVVAQCGNISAAAKKLYISQPAVSKSISKLEENFPTPLLQRTSKGVILTESGQILYNQLETAFQAIKQGEEQIQQNNELGVGTISIGVSTTLCKYVLLPYLKSFIAANPNIKVNISCQSTYETLTALENGSLDIGLVGESERLGNLTFQPIQTIHDTLVTSPEYLEKLTDIAAKTFAKADLTALTETELMSSATFLMLNKNNVTRQHVDRYLASKGLTLDNQIVVTTMDLLIDFAKLGLGIACVIKEFVTDEFNKGELLEFVTEEAIPERKIGFAYTNKGLANPALQKFLQGM